MTKRLLIVCPTVRDRLELTYHVTDSEIEIIFDIYPDTLMESAIWQSENELLCDEKKFVQQPSFAFEHIIKTAQQYKVDGITSTDDYPGSALVAAACETLGMPGSSLQSILSCQHKYYARSILQQAVPEATVSCKLFTHDIDDTFSFPCFVKPIKSFFSYKAHRINAQDELSYIDVDSGLSVIALHMNWFLYRYTDISIDASGFIVEGLIHGTQFNVDGYVQGSSIVILGIVDSIMYPETGCFLRFEYPSKLPQTVQKRIGNIAIKAIRALGLDNTLFNIEMMYDPSTNTINIIEINSRMAAQFADLYYKVNGYNLYSILVDLALGRKVLLHQQRGSYVCAASFVMRTFRNGKVVRVPSEAEIAHFYSTFPDARFYCFYNSNDILSDSFQDGISYRYALVHLGGSSWDDLYQNYRVAQVLLPFEFEYIS